MRKLAEVFRWLILAGCFLVWVFAILALVISSGSPHFEGSGWSQKRIKEYEHTVHIMILLFYLLPVLFFSDVIGLWLLRRVKAT